MYNVFLRITSPQRQKGNGCRFLNQWERQRTEKVGLRY